MRYCKVCRVEIGKGKQYCDGCRPSDPKQRYCKSCSKVITEKSQQYCKECRLERGERNCKVCGKKIGKGRQYCTSCLPAQKKNYQYRYCTVCGGRIEKGVWCTECYRKKLVKKRGKEFLLDFDRLFTDRSWRLKYIGEKYNFTLEYARQIFKRLYDDIPYEHSEREQRY